MIEITDEDIEQIELKLGLTFDDESKEFIKCLDTKDIQACPGAGKTTSLVAKLGILSKYMPFENNSGILVLTHTNVAVDEIKEKLGVDAQKLLRYPNHVGTFQSFVNKYLAIPMYVKKFGKRPKRIDSDFFVETFFSLIPHTTMYGLKEKLKKGTSSDDEKIKKVKLFLQSFYVDEDGLLKNFDGNNFMYKHNPPSQTYTLLKTLKEDITKKGVISYSDSYYLSSLYLSKYPNIKEVFQKRFKYIFIDETQDTDGRQFEILNNLFSESIVQKIGDNNQAIFHGINNKNDTVWAIEDDFIEIKNTKRLSSLVADQVFKIAIEPQELNGDDAIIIQPTIILFDHTEDVLQKFAELIVEYGLHRHENKTFKAVGGVAKHNDNGDTLPSYYPAYSQSNNSSLKYDNLVDKIENSGIENIRLKDYRNIVLDIVVKYLKEKNILSPYGNNKSFTKNSILSFLRENYEDEYNDFKFKLFEITQKLVIPECAKDEVRGLLDSFLALIGETMDDDTLNMVIEKYEIKVKNKLNTNVYKYEAGGANFDIEVSTIHRVKGETHIATLVLETFNRSYDLYHLIKLFQGRRHAGANVDKKKLIYVAMSRPTHFLCLAMHKMQKNGEISSEEINKLTESGFRVVSSS